MDPVIAPPKLGYSMLPRQRVRRGPFIRTLKWLGVSIFWIGLGGGIVGGLSWALATQVGALFVIFVPPALILLMVCGVIMARGARRVRDLSVLHYLEYAVRVNAPPTAFLAAAERDEYKPVRIPLRRLRMRLQADEPIGLAISAAAPALPPRVSGVIMVGENTGCLASSMRRIVESRDILPPINPTDSIFYRWYPLMLLVVSLVVVETVVMFALPKYEVLLHDFHVHVPTSTRILRQFPTDWGLASFFVAGVVLAIFCGRMLSQIFAGRGLSLGPLSRATEVVIWYTPILGNAVRSTAMADLCHALASALDAGSPPSYAIAECAGVCGNLIAERRVRQWSGEVLSGTAIGPAARAAKMPAVIAQMLTSAGNTDNLSETLRFLGNYYDARFSRAAVLLRGALMQLLAIGVGALVLLVALSVFQPLVELINHLSSP